MKPNLSLCISLVFAIHIGCAPKSNHASSQSDVKAPDRIESAFSVLDSTAIESIENNLSTLSTDDNYNLKITKAALDKEFLLTASLIPQAYAPTSSGLRARVVVFKRYGKSVFLLEATQGHVVTHDLPSQLILAEIPVLNETESELVLDFNKGMQKVFVEGAWWASDFDGKSYVGDVLSAIAIEASHSFIQAAKVNPEKNRLEIRQIAQLNIFGIFHPNVETRYYLEPYRPNLQYQSKETSNFKHVGYFETPPVLETTSGRSTVRVTKWDDKNPIKYYVSANTPKEYVEAVKEGILYWNKAFGPKLSAEVAPEGVTAPDPDYNLVQWVPWDEAGFAYADALMDPRTGEIKHSQIYMTSAFSFWSKVRARRLLRTLRQDKTEPAKLASELGDMLDSPQKTDLAKTLRNGLALSFLQPARLCYMELQERLAQAVETLLATGADDAALLRVSQDYVRIVVAHEVGHTLGLRHNFAGNLAANVTMKEGEQLFSDYLLKGTAVPIEKTVLSSVMEYATFQDDILAGSQFKDIKEAFSYDKAAIGWGYLNRELDRSTAPLFCTDSHLRQYADCQVFDSGAKPIAFLSGTLAKFLTELPHGVVETFMMAKAPPDPRDAIPVDEVNLHPQANAQLVGQIIRAELSWLRKGKRLLSLERRLPFVGPLNEEEVEKSIWNLVKSELEELGGVDRVLFGLLPLDLKSAPEPKGVDLPPLPLVQKAKERLNVYLEREDVKNFVGADGKVHSFTTEEIKIILERTNQFFEELDEKILDETLNALAEAKYELEYAVEETLVEEGVNAAIEQKLQDVAEAVILAKDDKIMGVNIKLGNHSPTVLVTNYKYSNETRMRATKILSASLGPVADWGADARNAVADKLKADLQSMLGNDVGMIKPTDIQRQYRQWFTEQMGLVSALGGGSPTAATTPQLKLLVPAVVK